MPIIYQRVTKNVWVIQRREGYEQGWTDIGLHDSSLSAREALRFLRSMQNAPPQDRLRMTRRRIKCKTDGGK